MTGRTAARLAVALLGLLLGACAPRLQPPGIAATAPKLLADRIVAADGMALPLRVWMPAGEPKAVILALHGFDDYSKAFEEPARFWAEQGIATYAYDQRGFGAAPHHGYWPGVPALVADLRAAAALVHARHPGKPLYLLGESMGGAVLMAAAASPAPPETDGLILVAPAIWGRETQGLLHNGALWLAAHTMPWLTLTGRGLNIQPSDNIAMLRALGQDPLVIKETRVDAIWGLVNLMDVGYAAAPHLGCRTLILYGSREQIIPEDAAVSMIRRLPKAAAAQQRIAFYPRGYHMLLRDLGAAVVRRDIAAWIADPSLPLPSGADHGAEVALARGDGSLKVEEQTVARPVGAP